jgi:hypothetical protein
MKGIVLSACILALASTVLAAAPLPPTPAPVDDVVYARTFKLNEGFRYDWAKEPFTVTEGTLLVIKAKPEYLTPRQTFEPMLYVGDHAAMKLNRGEKSGYVIVVVPGEVDLSKTLIWFGTPSVAERVDNSTIATEQALAAKAGLKPLSAAKAAKLRGERINSPDFSALLRDHVAGLVEQYSPVEKDLASQWRTPVGEFKPATPDK